jgi:hypothetical protein
VILALLPPFRGDNCHANLPQFLAKAFLEKDYEAVKAKRTVNKIPEHVASPVTTQQKEDVAMTDSSAVPESEKLVTQTAPLSEAKPLEQLAGEASSKMDVDVKASTGTAAVPNTEPEDSTRVGDTVENNQVFPDVGEETLNFNGPNDFDLNLDFGNDDIGNQNFLAGTNFMESSAANISSDGPENPGSISSLLPGLESYATNNTDDHFNFDFNKLSGESEQQLAGDQKNNSLDDMALHGESSFDDLFMEKDNFGADGDDDLLGDNMDFGEIDGSWLQ